MDRVQKYVHKSRIFVKIVMSSSAESSSLLTCPYEPECHVNLRPGQRFLQHLVKCRQSIQQRDPAKWRRLQRSLATCKYYQGHIVPREMLDQHEAKCEYAESFQQAMQDINLSGGFSAWDIETVNSKPDKSWKGEENWSDDESVVVQVLPPSNADPLGRRRAMVEAGQKLVINFSNMPRSRRRELREEHRLATLGADVEDKGPIPGLAPEDAAAATSKSKKKRKKKKSKAKNEENI